MAVSKKSESLNVMIKQAQVGVAKKQDAVSLAKELLAAERNALSSLLAQKAKGRK